MKVVKYLFVSVLMSLALVSAVFSQGQTAKGPYQLIEVEKFTIRQGVEFPAEKVDELSKGVINTLTRSNRFEQVMPAGETAPAGDAGTAPKLKISAEVIKYVKGSQAMRYLVGFGTGKTKIIADVKFTDAATGELIHQQTVDGEVTWGIFGGDSDGAKSGLADEIIRVMKTKGFAGDKKKTKK